MDVAIAGYDRPDALEVLITMRGTATAPASAPLAPVVLVVDVSDGMRTPTLVDALEQVTRGAAGRVPFGLVVFDATARLVRPADQRRLAPTDRTAIEEALYAGGAQNLGAGLARGIAEARRVATDGAARVVVVTAGGPNRGVTDPASLAAMVRHAADEGIAFDVVAAGAPTTPVIDALAEAAGRSAIGTDHTALAEALTAATGTQQPLSALAVTVTARGVGNRVAPRLAGLPDAVWLRNGDVTADAGDLVAGESRTVGLLVPLDGVDAAPAAAVAELEVRWTDARTMRHEAVVHPLGVELVPGEAVAYDDFGYGA